MKWKGNKNIQVSSNSRCPEAPLEFASKTDKKSPWNYFHFAVLSTGSSHTLPPKPCSFISSLIPPAVDHPPSSKHHCSRSILSFLLQGDRSKYLFTETHPFCQQRPFLSPWKQLLSCERAAVVWQPWETRSLSEEGEWCWWPEITAHGAMITQAVGCACPPPAKNRTWENHLLPEWGWER